jgi:predicted NBD/HSP70 family sugar kinase
MQEISNITHENVREVNYIKILQHIKRNDGSTKAELTKYLDVSHTTINSYIQTLMDEGFVVPSGTADSSGGRKPVILKIEPNTRYSFGIRVSPDNVYLILVNFLGEKIDLVKFPYSGMEDALIELREHIYEMINRYSIDMDKILGVGMAFPGLVDMDNLILEYIPNLNLSNYSLKKFESDLGLRVFPDNEANAGTYAEYLVGRDEKLENFVYVSIAEGIGTGIMDDHFLFRGKNKRAGEFGHLKVSDQMVRCNCGRYGCWELFASMRALLKDKPESVSEELYLDRLFKDYDRGDSQAVRRIERYVRYLFAGLDVVLLSVDPSVIIIGGDLGDYAKKLIDIGINKLGLTKYFYGYESVRIIPSNIKSNAALLGAALLPLEQIFRFRYRLNIN